MAGFTLIELVIVMILVALLSGLVMYSVRGHVDAAAIQRAAEQFQSLDRRLRAETRRAERAATIQFRDKGRRISVDSETDLSSTGIDIDQTLPGSVSVESLRLARVDGSSATGRVLLNAHGQSVNYAVHLVTASGAEAWVVTLGVSGQQIRCRTEGEVDAMLRP